MLREIDHHNSWDKLNVHLDKLLDYPFAKPSQNTWLMAMFMTHTETLSNPHSASHSFSLPLSGLLPTPFCSV
jgi:hypothetical protein